MINISAILWQDQVTFWWDDDNICFVLDQNVIILWCWNYSSHVDISLHSDLEPTSLSIHFMSYWLGMRVIARLLSPRYQLLPEATPRTIVGTKGTTKVLLHEYQVYECFIIYWTTVQFKILNCRSFSDGFLVYFINAF